MSKSKNLNFSKCVCGFLNFLVLYVKISFHFPWYPLKSRQAFGHTNLRAVAILINLPDADVCLWSLHRQKAHPKSTSIKRLVPADNSSVLSISLKLCQIIANLVLSYPHLLLLCNKFSKITYTSFITYYGLAPKHNLLKE